MRSDDMLRAIGGMADRHIDDRPIEDIPKKRRMYVWVRLAAVAACVALLVGVGYMVVRKGEPAPLSQEGTVPNVREPSTDEPILPVYPDQNIAASQLPDSTCWAECPPVDVAAMAHGADSVIVADVVDRRLELSPEYKEHPDAAHIFESYPQVVVREVLKGDLTEGDTIFVWDHGYYYDDVPQTESSWTPSGGPFMEKGNRVVLFLDEKEDSRKTPSGEDYYTLWSSYLGVFFLDQDGLYHERATYATDYAFRRLIGPFEFTDDEPKTLDEIKAVI